MYIVSDNKCVDVIYMYNYVNVNLSINNYSFLFFNNIFVYSFLRTEELNTNTEELNTRSSTRSWLNVNDEKFGGLSAT